MTIVGLKRLQSQKSYLANTQKVKIEKHKSSSWLRDMNYFCGLVKSPDFTNEYIQTQASFLRKRGKNNKNSGWFPQLNRLFDVVTQNEEGIIISFDRDTFKYKSEDDPNSSEDFCIKYRTEIGKPFLQCIEKKTSKILQIIHHGLFDGRLGPDFTKDDLKKFLNNYVYCDVFVEMPFLVVEEDDPSNFVSINDLAPLPNYVRAWMDQIDDGVLQEKDKFSTRKLEFIAEEVGLIQQALQETHHGDRYHLKLNQAQQHHDKLNSKLQNMTGENLPNFPYFFLDEGKTKLRFIVSSIEGGVATVNIRSSVINDKGKEIPPIPHSKIPSFLSQQVSKDNGNVTEAEALNLVMTEFHIVSITQLSLLMNIHPKYSDVIEVDTGSLSIVHTNQLAVPNGKQKIQANGGQIVVSGEGEVYFPPGTTNRDLLDWKREVNQSQKEVLRMQLELEKDKFQKNHELEKDKLQAQKEKNRDQATKELVEMMMQNVVAEVKQSNQITVAEVKQSNQSFANQITNDVKQSNQSTANHIMETVESQGEQLRKVVSTIKKAPLQKDDSSEVPSHLRKALFVSAGTADSANNLQAGSPSCGDSGVDGDGDSSNTNIPRDSSGGVPAMPVVEDVCSGDEQSGITDGSNEEKNDMGEEENGTTTFAPSTPKPKKKTKFLSPGSLASTILFYPFQREGEEVVTIGIAEWERKDQPGFIQVRKTVNGHVVPLSRSKGEPCGKCLKSLRRSNGYCWHHKNLGDADQMEWVSYLQEQAKPPDNGHFQDVVDIDGKEMCDANTV
ncbi:expressed unknown protein [Seminavis robusta]|uniref:Uncharacterized protein n=1 Tax=Seminavis robusta TaxID=568900 RepID=A0A9N8EFC6_9STRA|nr:expressed unknown protein [Seminavis robusta]|eukprot:Sro917_g219930.1 n/a (781) ;mRNA; r:26765-29199